MARVAAKKRIRSILKSSRKPGNEVLGVFAIVSNIEQHKRCFIRTHRRQISRRLAERTVSAGSGLPHRHELGRDQPDIG